MHPANTATATGTQGILSEGREQRHDQGKQASKRPVLDRPQTRIDESHHPRRQLPDSSHHASSRKYGPSKEPPSAPPKSSPSPQFDVPQADLLEAGWPLLSQLAGRQGETRWGETQPGPSRTHKRHQTAQSRHAQTRAVKIPSGTSDCLLKFRCCSNHPPRSVSVVPTRGPLRTPQTRSIPRHQIHFAMVHGSFQKLGIRHLRTRLGEEHGRGSGPLLAVGVATASRRVKQPPGHSWAGGPFFSRPAQTDATLSLLYHMA